MLIQFLTAVLLLSLKAAKHFQTLTMPSFNYIGSVAIPASEHHLVVPFKVLIYSSSNTLNIQKLNFTNEYDGAVQVKTNSDPITQIHASQNGDMICILDSNKKIFCSASKETGGYENLYLINGDTMFFKKIRLTKGYILSRVGLDIIINSYNRNTKQFISDSIRLHKLNNKEGFPQKMDITSDGNNIVYSYYSTLDSKSYIDIYVNKVKTTTVENVLDFRYDSNDNLIYLQLSGMAVLLSSLAWSLKQNAATPVAPDYQTFTHTLSPSLKNIMIYWISQSALKVLLKSQLNSFNVFLLSDFFQNSDLTAQYLENSWSLDIIQVGHKINTQSVDLYMPCHYSCSQCQTSICTCDATKNRQSSTDPDKCSCMDNYYDDSTSQQCQSCHYSCETCSGPAFDDCLTCPGTRTFNPSTSACQCMPGQYDDQTSQSCKSCRYSCETCSGPAFDDCQTCSDTGTRTFNPFTSACQCMPGQYDDQTSQQCESCHYSCETCSGPAFDDCSTCPDIDTRQYDNVANTCSCIANHFEDSNKQCKSCHYSCVSCSGLAKNQCTSCQNTDNRQYDAAANTCSCITKYYDDSAPQCKSCLYSCKTCTGQSTNCTSCNEEQIFQRTMNGNKCLCKIGFFDNGVQKCAACHQSCSSCISQNFCETCQLKYFDNGGHYCQPCKYSCATCVQSDSNCSSCSSRRFKDQENNCVCKDGQFDDGTDNQTCQICHSSCKTCSNQRTCDLCKQGFYKYQGEEDVCFEEKFKIDIVKSDKIAGKNEVRLVFELDNPNEIAENETKVQIVSPKGQNESLTWETTQEGASTVTLLISYNSGIQKRKVKITFYSRQQTGRRVLEVLVPVFEGQVEIETYPPAQVASQTSALSLDDIKNTVLAFSVILVILCLICLLLPRAHFYAFKYSWTIQKVFIAFGICPEIMTSWLKYCLQPLSQVSFVGGIQAYECCQPTDFLGYTANIFANSSISLFILLGLWIIYLPIAFCLKSKPKVIMYYRLFILTLSLMLLPHCLFAVFNTFYDAGKNQPNAPNIVIACILLIVFIVFVVKLIWETRKIPGPEVHHLSEITRNQETQNNNEAPNLVLFPNNYDSESANQERWLQISYLSCLSSSSKLVRFNLIIIVSKIFLFCLFCAVLQGGNLVLYVLLIFVDPVSEICYLILRPNKHIGKFLLEIGFQLCWLTVYILMCAFTSDYSKQVYSEGLEVTILGFILGIIIYSILLLIGNVIMEFVQGPENMQAVKVIDSSEIKLGANAKVQQ